MGERVNDRGETIQTLNRRSCNMIEINISELNHPEERSNTLVPIL